MLTAYSFAKRPLELYVAIALAVCGTPAFAAELVGRAVDTSNAKVFAGAVARARSFEPEPRTAMTDRHGFFRLPDLAPGPYLLDVNLPDGRMFAARVVILPSRKTQFLDLDYARIAPPEDDEDY